MLMTYGPEPTPPLFVHLSEDEQRAARIAQADKAALRADKLARLALERFDADQRAAHAAAAKFRDHPTEANRQPALDAVAVARRSREIAATCAKAAATLAAKAVQARD